jgi:cytochrome c oxidase cbb3-type subunit I/II
MSPGSIMPAYPAMLDNELDLSDMPAKISALRKLGHPYPKNFEGKAIADAQKQAQKVADNLKSQGVKDEGIENKEMVAIIAYLQRLGTDIKVEKSATNK